MSPSLTLHSFPSLKQAITKSSNNGASRTKKLRVKLSRRLAFFFTSSRGLSLIFQCLNFKKVLDPSHYKTIKEQPQSTPEYLHFTRHWLPHRFFCSKCHQRHRRNEACIAVLSKRPLYQQAALVPHFKNIPFEHVQLHMRQHKFGREHGRPAPEIYELTYFWKDHTWEFRYIVDAAVVKGHLLLKIKCITHVTRYNAFNDLKDEMAFLPHCGHYTDELKRICHCALRHTRHRSQHNPHFCHRLDGCRTCRPLRRCHTCASEYAIYVKPHGAQFRLHITRWVDLGDGELPLCREWKACAEQNLVDVDQEQVFDLDGRPSVKARFEKSKRRWWRLRVRKVFEETPYPLGELTTEEDIAEHDQKR